MNSRLRCCRGQGRFCGGGAGQGPHSHHAGGRHQRLPSPVRGGRRYRYQRWGAIAREIADITIAADSLFELVTLRRIAQGLMRRIHGNYRFVIGFNGALIELGVAGILLPATSAMLHNLSTLCVSLQSMTDLLDRTGEPAELPS